MLILKTQTDSTITLAISGKLDSVTQADLARELETVFAPGVTGLVFDLTALEYISSAGLRVFLSAQKKAKSLGTTMKIVGANDAVKEIFQIIKFDFDV
jgi:anti-sigma B factor antagonist